MESRGRWRETGPAVTLFNPPGSEEMQLAELFAHLWRKIVRKKKAEMSLSCQFTKMKKKKKKKK